MDVSIIIPVLNEEKRIANCLNSILKQNFTGSYEIIVVNGGCTDNTINIINNYKSVKIIDDFGPLGSARQSGLEEAEASFIVFIDADEIADFDWLSELYKFKDEYDAVLGSVRTTQIDNNIFNKYFNSLAKLSITHSPKQSNLITFSSANALINREKALHVGFDRSLPTSEDGDFSYRFIQNKYSVFYNPNAVIYHDATPYDLNSFIKYQNKLAYGLILNIKKFKSFDLIKIYILSMLYPISPVFLIRVLRIEKQFDIYYLILGLVKFLSYFMHIFSIFLPRSNKKIIRPK